MTKDRATAGQVSASAAEIYDTFFVPALFGEWAAPLCEAARVAPGSAVLDVACGTGATTRQAAQQVGSAGQITGLDRNAGMLDVARARAPDIDWVEARAEEMPFADNTFDTVLCQFGLMFFDDRSAALGEMRRVLRPGGTLALSVWDDVAHSPGYAGMIALIDRLFGPEPANALRAPFVLGAKADLDAVLHEGGLAGATVTTQMGRARFASIREWVRMDVRGWTLAEMIDDAGFETLVEAAEKAFVEYKAADGTVSFPAPAHLAVWQKP